MLIVIESAIPNFKACTAAKMGGVDPVRPRTRSEEWGDLEVRTTKQSKEEVKADGIHFSVEYVRSGSGGEVDGTVSDQSRSTSIKQEFAPPRR